MKWGMKVVAALVVALCAAPAYAAAAAPANDDFANREALPAGVPVEVTRSNAEATKETGENISPYAAGHSVWFKWEATSTGWTTIGACGSDFPAVIGIFTGTEVADLTKVASGNAAEGPQLCGGEREYTFKAVAGTSYVIGVDGNAFHLPEAPVPVTEGEVVLRIEETPPPVNDDFANAENLSAVGQTYEFEPGEGFYFARLPGYNWNATKETGEPDHEGDPGGASVWYSWTAPATGLAHLSACCVAGPIIGIYTGTSIDALTPVPFNNEIWPEKQVQVTAGQTYMIAIDGLFDGGSNEAAQFSFAISVSMSLPPAPEEAPPATASTTPATSSQPPADTTPPDTKIDKTSLRAAARSAKFWFSASEPAQGFLCRLDKASFKPCGSPRTYKRLKPGRHAFRVKAVDVAGNVDGSAAVATFRVPKPQKRR
jgi:hypothetical protein